MHGLGSEIRTGELLKQLARNQTAGLNKGSSPHRGDTEPSPYAQALADNGISTQAASRYQAPPTHQIDDSGPIRVGGT